MGRRRVVCGEQRLQQTHARDSQVLDRALQIHREARMVSPVMGAAMIGTMYFLRANCAQHGGSASGGGLISASLLSYRALVLESVPQIVSGMLLEKAMHERGHDLL